MKNKKTILEVWGEFDDAKIMPRVCWEWKESLNSYFLIGVLENIKDELIKEIDKASKEYE